MAITHTFKWNNDLKTKSFNRSEAIRMKCYDCSCWQQSEILKCTVETCALYPFRMGKIHTGRKGGSKEGIDALRKHREIPKPI